MAIGQQPDQFRPGQRRVGIVHLDRNLGRQGAHIAVAFLKPPQNVLQRGGTQEKLLFQPQFLAGIGGVIGVEHAADGAGQSLGFRRRRIVAAVEPLQIKQRG